MSSTAEIRILVADSNEVCADLICDHLESLGYAADRVADADHAIAMAVTGEYQVMLVNVHMPTYDGVELLRRLHRLTQRRLRIIALMAGWLALRHEDLGRIGVDGYLTKPVDPAQLEQELNRVLDPRP